MDIPLELITVSTRKRLVGKRLIFALLSLILGPAIGGAAIGIIHLILGKVPNGVLGICMATGALVGALLFLVMLIRFFISQDTVTLNVAKGNAELEFWVSPEDGQELGSLLHEITRRVGTITDQIDYPIRSAAGDVFEQPWKRTVVMTWIFATPGLALENPWLLLLCVIPPGLHLYSALRSFGAPKAFRLAVKSFLKQDWSAARAQLEAVVSSSPDFVPGHLLLFDLLCREGRFDDAEIALAQVQDALDIESLQSIQEELTLRRRVWKRKREAACH